MKTLPRFRFVHLAHSALPLALFCAMASLPAAAVTIDTTSTARPAVTTQLAKSEKQELKAAKKAEKQARKLCKKRIKQARKLGQTYTCTPTGVEPAPEAAVASNTPPPANAESVTPPVAPPPVASPPPVTGTPLPGGSGKPPAASPANPPANPAGNSPANPPAAPLATPPAGAGGNSDPVQDALIGPNAIPAGFVNWPEYDEIGEPGEPLPSVATVPVTVPEPGSLVLLGAGLLGLSLATRRSKHKAAS